VNRNRGMTVLDTQKDWRFPDAEDLLKIRFYSGVVVTAADGMPVGCVSAVQKACMNCFLTPLLFSAIRLRLCAPRHL